MAKFTKEDVSKKIKDILKTSGGGQELSERTINDTLENLMIFAGEEIEIDAFVAQIQGGLISMNGNLRKEKADAAKLVAEKQAEIDKLKTPKPNPTPEPNPTLVSEEPEWAKKIREKMEAQELKEQQAAKQQALDQKLKKAKELAKAGGAINEKVLGVALSKLNISDDMTEAEISSALLPVYNSEYKEFYGEGHVPSFPTKAANPEQLAEIQKSTIDNVKKIAKKAGINVPE